MTGPITRKLDHLRLSLLAWAADGHATRDDLRLASDCIDALLDSVAAMEDRPVPARFRAVTRHQANGATIIEMPRRVEGGLHVPESAA